MTKCDITLNTPATNITIQDKNVGTFLIENKDKFIFNEADEHIQEMIDTSIANKADKDEDTLNTIKSFINSFEIIDDENETTT